MAAPKVGPVTSSPSDDERERAELARRSWQDANRERIESSNAYVERHGLPLTQFRQF